MTVPRHIPSLLNPSPHRQDSHAAKDTSRRDAHSQGALSDRSQGESLGQCPLCGRPLLAGPSVDRHHWVPRGTARTRTASLEDGEPNDREAGVSLVHVVCHRMIHRLFDETTLARTLNTPEALRAHPEMARFLAWIRRQPADYLDWPEQSGRHGRKARTRRRSR